MPLTPGKWVVSPTDPADVIALATPTRPYNTIVCQCPGYAPQREENARAISALPQLTQLLARLTATQGLIQIDRNIITFADGETFDLTPLQAQCSTTTPSRR